MGTSPSKTAANAMTIEADVTELIKNTNIKGVYIDANVKDHVQRALNVYKELAATTQKKNGTKVPHKTLNGNILYAKQLMDNLPIRNYESNSAQTGHEQNSFNYITERLNDIRNEMDKNEIEEKLYENRLQTVKWLTLKLYRHHNRQIEPRQQDEIDILFLKLFLKCLKAAPVPFNQDVEYLNMVIRHLESKKEYNSNISAEGKRILRELASRANIINALCQERMADTEQFEGKKKKNGSDEAVRVHHNKRKTDVENERDNVVSGTIRHTPPKNEKITNGFSVPTEEKRNQPTNHKKLPTSVPGGDEQVPETERNSRDSKENSIQNYNVNRNLAKKLKYQDTNYEGRGVYPSETSSVQNKVEGPYTASSLNTRSRNNEEIIENNCPPVDAKVLIVKENEFNDPRNNEVKQVSEESSEILKKKGGGSETGRLMKKSTKDELEDSLKQIEEEIFHVIDLSISFEEKKTKLNEFKTKLKQVDSVSTGINFRVTKIINQIESIMIAELTKYLKQISGDIDQIVVKAAQFPFPKKIDAFETKRKEIEKMGSLLNPFKELPEEYFHIRKHVQEIKDKIVKALDVLDKKAEYNDSVISIIESLENIKTRVNKNNLDAGPTNIDKLLFFNRCRKEIESVDSIGVSKKILEKKIQVYSLIHNFEKEIFKSHFTSWWKIKLTLHAWEKEALLMASPNFVNAYNLISQNIKGLHGQLRIRNDRLSKILCDTMVSIYELLKNSYPKINNIYHNIKYLNEVNNSVNNIIRSSASLNEKTRSFEACQRDLDKREKVDDIEHEEYLSTLKDVKKNIETKKHLVDLLLKEKDLKEFIKQKNSLSCTVSSFKEIMDKVFAFTEVVNMPMGDEHLEARKQNFLKELVTCLDFLDPRLVNLLTQKQTSESILNLNEHFALHNNLANVPKNTRHFVELIRKKAEELEDQAKNYLGATDSVDYYVINENLFQLLQELDNVLCDGDDDLFKYLVGTIDYIKGLIQQLELNVTN